VRCSYLYFARYRDFYIRPVWFEITYSRPILGSFGAITPKWIPILSQPPKGPSLGEKCRMNHKLWKSIHGFDLGACPRKIQYNQSGKKSQNRNSSPSGRIPRCKGVANLKHASPHMCYRAEFGRSTLKDVARENLQNWVALSAVLGWEAWLTPRYTPLPTVYYVKFGSPASNGVCINRREPQIFGSAGVSPLCSMGVADRTNTPLPSCVRPLSCRIWSY